MLFVILTIAGCGKSKKPSEVVHPTTGVVTLDGQPLAGAIITFLPQNAEFPDTVRPKANSSDDGKFVGRTYAEGDGLPEGEYKVLVLRFPPIVSSNGASSGPNDLPMKYARKETTDLVASIKGPKSEITLDLKKK